MKISNFFPTKKVYAGGAPILAATEATNGYVYVLGKVLPEGNPKPRAKGQNILKELEKLENASIFTSLLKRTNFTNMLEGKLKV